VVVGGILTATLPGHDDYGNENLVNVAIKKVNPDVPEYFRALGDELKILAYVGHHLNIVNLMGYYKGNLEIGINLVSPN